jgi:DNA-directed RNA polymerase sigma subunit (sigma70/sigma32)
MVYANLRRDDAVYGEITPLSSHRSAAARPVLSSIAERREARGDAVKNILPDVTPYDNDSLRSYLREISTQPLLNHEQEIALAKRIEAGMNSRCNKWCATTCGSSSASPSGTSGAA